MSWNQPSCLVLTCLGILALGSTLAFAATGTPHGISPGAAGAFVSVGTPCPTFSWSAVEGAEGYELVVYETEGLDRTPGEQPAIRTRISNGLSWTPSTESCLELSVSYVWSVRALNAAGAGGWSEGRMFKVEAGSSLEQIGGVLERALARYLEARGVQLAPTGELAGLIAAELAAPKAKPAPAASVSEERVRYSGGRRLESGKASTRGVFIDEVELWLEEAGSGASDKVQIVFATPEFDGTPPFNDAWAIVVSAEDSASADDGRMFISNPGFTDVLQMFTDGSTRIPELRELILRRLTSPPFTCTSLQEGSFYWDEQANALCVCDGSSWDTVDAANVGTCA